MIQFIHLHILQIIPNIQNKRVAANKEATEPRVHILFVKLKSSLRMLYGSHHDFVDRYGISESPMTSYYIFYIYSKICLKGQLYIARRVWTYQRGNHNPYIEEEETTQWQKEKVHEDKQRSIKHTYTTKKYCWKCH
jgi:hypothetical protein